MTKTFTVEDTTLKTASRKAVKYDEVYIKQSICYCIFTFDTFVFLTPEIMHFLQRIQSIVHINVASLKSMNIVLKGLVLLKGIEGLFVARCM